MIVNPDEYRWVTTLSEFYGTSEPELRSDSNKDIAYSPGVILLGRRFKRSNPKLRRKKITHEYLHHLGFPHNQHMRDVGYYSNPKRDRLSERVVSEVERWSAVHNPVTSSDDGFYAQLPRKSLRSSWYIGPFKSIEDASGIAAVTSGPTNISQEGRGYYVVVEPHTRLFGTPHVGPFLNKRTANSVLKKTHNPKQLSGILVAVAALFAIKVLS